MEWYENAAAQGKAAAQFNLSRLYAKGRGVPQDSRKARELRDKAAAQGLVIAPDNPEMATYRRVRKLNLYEKAAAQGNAEALNRLGMIYEQGIGVPQDYGKAVEWYEKAAAQGDAAAQLNLGEMCEKGFGVPQDYARAYMWVNLAAAQGWPDAVKARDVMNKTFPSSQIEEGQRLTREWLAANPGK